MRFYFGVLTLILGGVFTSVLSPPIYARPVIEKQKATPCPHRTPTSLFKTHNQLKKLEFPPAPPSPLSPILVGLHGLGDQAKRFARIRSRFPKDWRFIFIEAPLHYRRGFGWYRFRCDQSNNDADLSVQHLTQTIREIKETYPHAPLGLFGFSQGGVMSLKAIHFDPSLYQAVASLSGYWLGSTPHDVSQPYPLLIAHGTQDRVVPWSKGQLSAHLFKKAGYQVQWVSFDQGHTIPHSLYPQLIDFFQTHLNKKKRKHISK